MNLLGDDSDSDSDDDESDDKNNDASLLPTHLPKAPATLLQSPDAESLYDVLEKTFKSTVLCNHTEECKFIIFFSIIHFANKSSFLISSFK